MCPCLIVLLGEPKADKQANIPHQGRPEVLKSASGSSVSPQITHSSAKVIYSAAVVCCVTTFRIAGELASLVGEIPQLRPVLESLYHKMLMFPLPQNRHDSLKVVKELMSSPQKVISLLGCGSYSTGKPGTDTNMALITLLMESVQQCSHCPDPAILFSSVACIDNLLASLDRIRQGEGIPDSWAKLEKSPKSPQRRSMTSNPDDDGGSDLPSDHYNNDSQDDPCEETDEPPTQSHQESSILQDIPQSKIADISPSRAQFEAAEKENAELFVSCLRQLGPELVRSLSVLEVDDAIQDLASRFVANVKQQNAMAASVEGTGNTVVLNADGVYMASVAAFKLCIKLTHCGYYDDKANMPVPVAEVDFLNEMFSSGLLLYLPPVWLKEVYAEVVGSSLLTIPHTLCHSPSRRKDMNHLVHFIQDLEGSGSRQVSSRLTCEYREEMDQERDGGEEEEKEGEGQDHSWKEEAGKALASCVLSTCWPQVLDVLSVMLNEQGTGGGGVTHNLQLLLATDSAREDVRRARSAICTSLNGLQRAAKLCCFLGLQQLCGSAFAQLARTSCVKEDFRAMAASEVRGQVKGSGVKAKLVRLHAAHVLSMDVVMTTALETASHAADCWKHVFRCCAHISELEHTYFSQGNNQSSLPKVLQGSQGKQPELDEADGSCDTDMYSSTVVASAPIAPRINVPALIEQSSLESGWDNSLEAGGVLTFGQASKALCGLSQEVDSLFEDAAHQLCLEALLDFLRELGEASLSQLHKLGSGGGHHGSTRPPTNALHLYRLQQVLVRVVNSSRPLLHLLRVWSVVSPYLVQHTGYADHEISKMAVTSIHEFIVSLISQREERPHFHVNEFLCKTFEDMLCLELCDGDVQDQIVCSICELVEACSSLLQSGWRPLFGALRSVKIEYTTNEEVNQARRRHVAAVMDVFDVYLAMDSISVFASATVDCVLCLLKYVHGPATFDSETADDRSDDSYDDQEGEGELESLCVPALGYLTKVCQILASMWQMPACPVFKGAHRIQVDTKDRLVSPEIMDQNFKLFAEEFEIDKHKPPEGEEPPDTKDQSDDQGHKKGEPPIRDDAQSKHGKPEKEEEPTQSQPIQQVVKMTKIFKIITGVSKPEAKTMGQISENDKETGQMDREAESKGDVINNAKRPSTLGEETGLSSVYANDAFQRQQSVGGCRTLDEMDSPSGVLHVWFLLLDGLVSAINHCPDAFQSHTLNTLIDILRGSTKVPGPEFSMYCVNHLVLPMLQFWQRRGAQTYGFWATGLVSFKQSMGLVADLVVEFVDQFVAMPELQPCLQLTLKQMFDVLTECVAQPTETISRLGCSCIRHILLSAGPSFSEPLWQVGGHALQKALGVTTYNLRLLMALFHPNSDNFYGDIGQVKVATRKDCTVMECLRLRQMAKQVFLLDKQVSSMPSVQYDTDQDKSYVFLLYPPSHKDSLNPDHISTRVSFRHVVVGLLSSQLLLQTVGEVLLGRSADKKELGCGKGLPGQMVHMTTRVVHQFLTALEDSHQTALDFDSRPGLKFLMQKVAGLDVAANMYKQAATAVLFQVHALLEICANLENSSMDSTKAAMTPSADSPEGLPTIAQIKELTGASRNVPQQDGELFLPLLQYVCEDLCQTYIEVLTDANKGSILDKISEQPIFFINAQHEDIPALTKRARLAMAKAKSIDVATLKHDKAGKQRPESGLAAGIGGLAVESPQNQLNSDSGSESESLGTQDGDPGRGGEEEPEEENRKSKREQRQDAESRKPRKNSLMQVYQVATEQVIGSLMNQYKRHKHQRSMPNFVRPPKFPRSKAKVPRKEVMDEALDQQHRSSIMKDSSGHLQAWADTLTAVLQMTLTLSDPAFSALLPLTFTFTSQLILFATDSALRHQLSQVFTRLGRQYQFAPPETSTISASSSSAGDSPTSPMKKGDSPTSPVKTGNSPSSPV